MADRAENRHEAVPNDRGAMAIIIALLTLVFAGFLAIVVDVGSLYEERRDLQNGADAAALAVAQGCVLGEITCPSSEAAQPIAEEFASLNSDDGAARVLEADITWDGNEVTVLARTDDAGSNIDGDTTTRDHFFARIWGNGGTEVGAEASAYWGNPGSGGGIPITFSVCEWANLSSGGFPTSFETIYFHDSSVVESGDVPDDCIWGPGQDADEDGDNGPGGFGFLQNNGGDCRAEFIYNEALGYAEVEGRSGAPHLGVLECDEEPFNGAAYFVDPDNQPFLVPIYEDVVPGNECTESYPPGQNCYIVTGFAAIEIAGIHFGGQWNAGTTPDCSPSQDCIYGRFLQEVDLATGIDALTGGGSDFGVSVVGLSG